jgi:hypothetical protein
MPFQDQDLQNQDLIRVSLTPKIQFAGALMLLPKLAAALLCFATLLSAQTLAPGTALPVSLNSTIHSKGNQAGQKIEGRLMQEVLLASGGQVKKGASVTGHVVGVKEGASPAVMLHFDAIQDEGKSIPLNVSLRAVAGSSEVFQAKTPVDAASTNESSDEWVTKQVGGDVVFRGRGYVTSPQGKVGRWSGSGVWGKLTPAGNCALQESSTGEQSLWVFSTTACGTYGLPGLKIAAPGDAAPLGDITLQSTKNIDIRSGSGWLLVVNSTGTK